MITLGNAPDRLTVVLSSDADFNCTIRAMQAGEPQNWPDGTQIILELGDAEWPAEVVDNLATWNVDQVDVDALIAAGSSSARLWYVNGTVRQLWASGEVAVRG